MSIKRIPMRGTLIGGCRRRTIAAVALLILMLQTASPALADGEMVPVYPLPSHSGSSASPSYNWAPPAHDRGEAAVQPFERVPLGAASGAGVGAASGRDGAENKFDFLSLGLGVVVIGIIGWAILNASDSSSIAGN